MFAYTSLRQTVDQSPAFEPFTLDQAKQHLRVDNTADDALISGLITAARRNIEDWTGRALVQQQFTWTIAEKPPGSPSMPILPMPLMILPIILSAPLVMRRPIDLPRSPVISVDVVTVTDHDGNVTTLVADQDYRVDLDVDPGRLRFDWQSTPFWLEHLQVAFTAGYDTQNDEGASVPPELVAAVKIWLAYLYEHRGDDDAPEFPKVIDYLIAGRKISYFA